MLSAIRWAIALGFALTAAGGCSVAGLTFLDQLTRSHFTDALALLVMGGGGTTLFWWLAYQVSPFDINR